MHKMIRFSGITFTFAIDQFRIDQIKRIYRRVRHLFRASPSSIPVNSIDAHHSHTEPEHPVLKPPRRPPLRISPTDPPERRALIEKVNQVDEWYHSIELPYDVITPGRFDHRPALDLYGLPERLDGQRVLEVATYDGFWAFEFERRGAASVTTIDLARFSDADHPPSVRQAMRENGQDDRTGRGFEIAKAALGSKVERKILSVYDLSPEVMGTFDFVFCGDLLLHLRDPMRALQNIYSVTRGQAIIVDVVDLWLNAAKNWDLVRYMSGYEDCVWWYFKPSTLLRMVRDAGFPRVEAAQPFRLDYTNGQEGPWRMVIHAFTE